MKRVVLCNCPSTTDVYKHGKLRAIIPQIPLVSLASLAGALRDDGHEVYVIDLANGSDDPINDLWDFIYSIEPNFFGISFTTPLVSEATELTSFVKKICPTCHTIAGGTHPTILPKEVFALGCFDTVVVGEGERIIKSVVRNKLYGVVSANERIKDLDELPMPAWDLFDLKEYKAPMIVRRKVPIGPIETSRGCYGSCTYCSGPFMHGHNIRVKSVGRVLDEIDYMLDEGFKEIHVWDDSFTYDVDRAISVMNGMAGRGYNVPIRLDCGIRVNSVFNRFDFFDTIIKTSIYGLAYGYESGNQDVLNSMRKGTTIEQAEKSTKMTHDYGLESIGFFMLGLLGDTPDTIEDTINFAIRLNPTYAKFTIMTPFPGTYDYNVLKDGGNILTEDWSKYNFHSDARVYKHPDFRLTHEYLWNKYNEAHKRFYFRKDKIIERILYDFKRGPIFALSDVNTAFQTFIKR